MDCGHVRANIEPFMEGALSPDQKAPMEKHLAECRECRHELEAGVRLERLLKSPAEFSEVSESFDAGFWAKAGALRGRSLWARVRAFADEAVPVPSLAQSCALFLAALVVGTAGGYLDEWRSAPADASWNRPAMFSETVLGTNQEGGAR